jgi:thiamine biosynthesis lipoprotein
MSNQSSHFAKEIKILISFLFIGALFFLFIRNFDESREYYRNGILMDTFIEVRIWGRDGERALNECWENLEYLAKLLDRFSNNSDIYRINSKAGSWVKVAEDTLEIINKAIYYAKMTDGYFDPTITPILKLWGFYDKRYRIPTEDEVKRELRKVDFRRIQIREKMVFIPKGMEIDLGGIAKGYILDRLLSSLKRYKIERALLNIGGQIGVYGKPKDGNEWEIRIRNPRKLDDYIGLVYINKGSVATSGDYERYFIRDGIRYCHLIDPKTGYPVREVMSVSIISENATKADALSTAFFVMGAKAISYWEKFTDLGVVIVFSDGKIWYSPNIHFVKNEDYKY